MVSASRTNAQALLLGEWACLGILYPAPTHGFAIAARLKPTGDIGRVWSLSRALTYRSLDQLSTRGYIHAIGEEPGTIEDVIEPYLIQQGYLQRTPRGRIATLAAYRHLGVTPPSPPGGDLFGT